MSIEIFVFSAYCSEMVIIFIQGFLMSASLIIAIGVQNAFILRQGIKQRNVFPAVMTAIVCDVSLITIGVLGFANLIERFPGMIAFVTWGGAGFLTVYAMKSFYSAFKAQALDQTSARGMVGEDSVQKTIAVILAISLLNPHVYLDTVVLLGGLSASHEGAGRYVFGIGAILASICWFFSLGYGARYLAPLFEKPRAWQILDVIIGIVMLSIAAALVL
ncbi:MAG: LysE/ArgO family amino acid transporter [Pseudomonadota bacterium]